MRSLIKTVAIVTVACGLTLGVQAVASAQHCGPSGGAYYGGGYGGGYGGYQNRGYNAYYGGNQGGLSIQYRQNYGPTWHNTSHYDYHPGGYQRHGNHYHYQPGHYDYHRSGHWDR